MKKFSEMQFVKPNLKQIEKKFNKIIEEFENAESFVDQDKALRKMFKYSDTLNTNFSIAYVKYTCDTTLEENIFHEYI